MVRGELNAIMIDAPFEDTYFLRIQFLFNLNERKLKMSLDTGTDDIWVKSTLFMINKTEAEEYYDPVKSPYSIKTGRILKPLKLGDGKTIKGVEYID